MASATRPTVLLQQPSRSKFPYEQDLRHEFVAELIGDSPLSEVDQGADIRGSRIPPVYDDVGVLREDLGAALGVPL